MKSPHLQTETGSEQSGVHRAPRFQGGPFHCPLQPFLPCPVGRPPPSLLLCPLRRPAPAVFLGSRGHFPGSRASAAQCHLHGAGGHGHVPASSITRTAMVPCLQDSQEPSHSPKPPWKASPPAARALGPHPNSQICPQQCSCAKELAPSFPACCPRPHQPSY